MSTVNLPSKINHFRARWVRLHLKESADKIYDPDKYGDYRSMKTVLGIKEFKLFEHTGGGGVIGIESLDGKVFNTIVYAQRQPRQWSAGSEEDKRTKDLEEVTVLEEVGTPVHIVATYKAYWYRGDPQAQPPKEPGWLQEVALYRNGEPYGKSYRKGYPMRWKRGQARIVFGVRSSFHAPANEFDKGPLPDSSTVDGTHGETHNPFFEGRISFAQVLKGALLEEEVKGLYEAREGGRELGCHCYDACKTGSNRFFPGVPVPCSGTGVCRRAWNGEPFAAGFCECLPGYSGVACERHCSELSATGCCTTDDDCPKTKKCDPETYACAVPVSCNAVIDCPRENPSAGAQSRYFLKCMQRVEFFERYELENVKWLVRVEDQDPNEAGVAALQFIVEVEHLDYVDGGPDYFGVRLGVGDEIFAFALEKSLLPDDGVVGVTANVRGPDVRYARQRRDDLVAANKLGGVWVKLGQKTCQKQERTVVR